MKERVGAEGTGKQPGINILHAAAAVVQSAFIAVSVFHQQMHELPELLGEMIDIMLVVCKQVVQTRAAAAAPMLQQQWCRLP